MEENQNLKENTELMDKYFPLNIFLITNREHDVLNLHWHDNIEIIYIIKGNAIFNIGGQEIESNIGDILFVNSGQLHSGFTNSISKVQYSAIVFSKSMMASNTLDPCHMKYIIPFLEGQFLCPVRIKKEDLNYTLLKSRITTIIHEFDKKKSGYELVIKTMLYLLTIDIFRNYYPLNLIQTGNQLLDKNIEKVKTIISYVEAHYKEKITIEKAAHITNYSPFHFCKVFKRNTGKTFIEFLNFYRINEAEKLLKTTQIPITEIAEMVGFCNINYFDHVYKQYRNYLPSHNRK
jgi:AraC family transcriptional activator of pobA